MYGRLCVDPQVCLPFFMNFDQARACVLPTRGCIPHPWTVNSGEQHSATTASKLWKEKHHDCFALGNKKGVGISCTCLVQSAFACDDTYAKQVHGLWHKSSHGVVTQAYPVLQLPISNFGRKPRMHMHDGTKNLMLRHRLRSRYSFPSEKIVGNAVCER